MEGFTKLFRGITRSTLWTKDNDTKVVWFFLMAEADQNGDVVCTIPGLAKACDISVDKAQAIIGDFLSPDPYSSTSDYEGRRIVSIDRGWKLLNHTAYRERSSKEDQASYDRTYSAARRKIEQLEKELEKLNKNKEVGDSRRQSEKVGEIGQAEAEADSALHVTERKGCQEFDTEGNWKTTLEVWSAAGPVWYQNKRGLREQERPTSRPVKELFMKTINSQNWADFSQGLNVAVTNVMQGHMLREHLGVLFTFIRDEKWIGQEPMSSEPLPQSPPPQADQPYWEPSE